MDNLLIEYVSPSLINPAKYNPRQITDQELSGLKESIRKFGFVEPVIVNKRTNTLVGGHQRTKAAELLGIDKIPVTFVDLDESEEKALNVALNAHTIQGKFDTEILSTLLEDIKLDLPDLHAAFNFEQLGKDLKIDFDPEKIPENSEIDTDNFGNDLEHTCPKCGFEFND